MMAAVSFEHADEVRAALRAIMADPAHGPDALSSPRVMASLLSDLLPDAPRESGLLAAAAQRDVAGMLRDHVSNGLDAEVAVSLAASSFATSTAFTPEACRWVAGELAIALGLTDPARHADARDPALLAEITQVTPASVPELPTMSVARQSPDLPHDVGAPHHILAGEQPQPRRPPGPSLPPAVVPQPPRDSGWRLATPLPGPYGTRDCPRCGRRVPRAAISKPHTSPGRLWCPGVPGIHYASRGGYLQYVTTPDDIEPDAAENDEAQAPSGTPEGSAAQRLAEAARLHAAGLLTEQEYQDKRQEIIRQL
jgi:hypothetical protein